MILPFSIEAYEANKGKAGFQVRHENGMTMRILCTDNAGTYPVVATTPDGIHGGYYANSQALQIHLPDPEPKWRPWKNESEIPELPIQVRWKNTIARCRTFIAQVEDSVIWVGGATEGIPLKEAFEELERTDGTPCGVLEQEAGK